MSVNVSQLSTKVDELSKKIEETADHTTARFLSLEREECLGKLSITGKNCPHRTPKERLFCISADLIFKVLGVRIEPGDVKSVSRLNASKKSPIIMR